MSQMLNGLDRAWRGKLRLTALLPGAAAALALAACAGDAPANSGSSSEQHGTIGMALAGQSPSGKKYRLRNALISVAGPTTSYISTEDNPNRTLFSADVVAGAYTVSLDSSWYLEQVDYTGQGAAVNATLTSANPQYLSVYVGVRTPVDFHFQVAGEDINLDKGGLDIGIDVND